MKVTFPANTTKPLATPTTTAAAAAFEPKSVLDVRRSPSPPSSKPADPLADHALINPHLVDWDSLMRELGLHDDSPPLNKPDNSSELPPVINSFPAVDLALLSDIPTYSANPFDVDFDSVDELIRLAECFDTNSVQLGHVILARLNRRLTSPAGKPLQRAAFYYKEALQSQLTGSTRSTHRVATSSEIVQSIKAHKAFAAVSPIPLFTSFAANQTVLESLDGSPIAHVVDFDIGLGGHWASFMKDLAGAPASLRISALVSEEYANESRLITENLTRFAREVNIRFQIDFVSTRSFEYLSFKAIRFAEGEKVAVLLSPAIFRQVGTGFLTDLRHFSPEAVVHVAVEGHMDTGTTSCKQAVIDGLEFYSTLLETLEAAAAAFGGDDWMRKVETFVVFPRIVEAAGRRGTWWREALVAAGLRQVVPSQFAEFQAECLLRKVHVRGFHVVRQQGELALCWHDRRIVATSAWRY